MGERFEDKYLALREENTALKKKKNEQEATIKRMYTKLAMIEEALKKKRQADDKKTDANAASSNQNDAEADGSRDAVIPVRRDIDTEKFIQVLRNENTALRKKNQALAEKNRWLQEKLTQGRPGKPLTASTGPTKGTKTLKPKQKAAESNTTSRAKSAESFQGATIEEQVQDARKLHREVFSGKLETALKSRLVLAEKQLVKLQKENEQLRAQFHGEKIGRNNNDSEESSDEIENGVEKPGFIKLPIVEVDHMKREVRERQAQLAILNARYENLEANALAEREIQEKTLEQMEQMNRQIHKLRTQLQDVQIENEELETRASKNGELLKEVELLRDQNHRLETRMTALCESPFINDAFQRKERIDRLFDLEKLTQQQKETITRMTDENHKLQQLVKELQGNVRQMKQSKDGVEAELQRVKHLLTEERNTKSNAPVQVITPRQPVAVAPAKPAEPIVVTIPSRQPDRRDASSSPLHSAQPDKKTDSLPVTHGASVVVARKYEDLLTPLTSLLDPTCEGVKDVKHLRNRVHMLQIAHLKSIQELERCEKMLQAQTDINRELSLEIEQLTTQKVAASNALQKRLRDIELLCEERQQRIERLEAEIRQLKYLRGKMNPLKPVDIETEALSSEDDAESDAISIPESLVLAASELQPGDQLIELWIRRAQFDRNFVSDSASTFVLCDFFDFESQSTPLMIGNRPEYDLVVTFKVTVDGFFLRYLASETLNLEVHQSVRGDFRVVGVAKIRLAKLLQSKGAIRNTELPVHKIQPSSNRAKLSRMGTLDVAMRLSMPICDIWRLHLQSFPSDARLLASDSKPVEILDPEKETCCNESIAEVDERSMNELQVTIFACRNLVAAGKASKPSAYAHYQLLGFPDIFTNIVPECKDPEFDLECARQTFILDVDACLLRFFYQVQLWFTVFDDRGTIIKSSQDSGMIGKCGVPLRDLVEGEKVKGWWQLLDTNNCPAGEISVLIEWKNPFQVLSARSKLQSRGMNDRTADLHVLDLDQQYTVLQAFSSCRNGRVNYRQFLHYTAPSEDLELVEAKIKERIEAVLEQSTQRDGKSKSIEDLLVPRSQKDEQPQEAVISLQQLVSTMEKLGVTLTESEASTLHSCFGVSQAEIGSSKPIQNFISVGYFIMHANPQISCRDRLLRHKLRHTVQAFSKQRRTCDKQKTFLTPIQVFERFDEQRSGYVSRAQFRRALAVLGFELQNTDVEYHSVVETNLPKQVQKDVNLLEASQEQEVKLHLKNVKVQLEDDNDILCAKQPAAVAHTSTSREISFVSQPPALSAAEEFQRRKNAFMDRMKIIASASNKSVVYEQIEKKRLKEVQAESQHLVQKSIGTSAIDERLTRFHRQQAAARTLQKHFRQYKSGGTSIETNGILECDMQLRKLFKAWSFDELDEMTTEVARLIETDIQSARKSKAIPKKQFGFFLSKVPRLAVPASLLQQLMNHFSVKKDSDGHDLIDYRSLLKFIKRTTTEDVEAERRRQQPLWRSLQSIGIDIAHALRTFELVGDVQSSGFISFRKFRDTIERLGIQLAPKDLRMLMVMFDVTGTEILYHSLLLALQQQPLIQELVQTMVRCCKIGIATLREKLFTAASSSDNGTVSKSELHDALIQSQNEFIQFTSRDAHVLMKLESSNSTPSVNDRISIDKLCQHLSNFSNRENHGVPLEELNKYSIEALQSLARNCRAFLTAPYSNLIGEFERFDWKQTGIVSLQEFITVARLSGFAVFSDSQLKAMAKVFGTKLHSKFGINYRQFLEWTTPKPMPSADEVEDKLRVVAQERARQLPSRQLTEVLDKWREVFVHYGGSAPKKAISRSLFRKICREDLRLSLSNEEMRSLLYAYDRNLWDEVDAISFVQLNWKSLKHQSNNIDVTRSSQNQHHELESSGKELVEELKMKLRSEKISHQDFNAALAHFSNSKNGENSSVGEGQFLLALRQLGAGLAPDKVKSIFRTMANGRDSLSQSDICLALDLTSDRSQPQSYPQRKQLDSDSRKRLVTAVEAAAKYSKPAFQAAFTRFQEFCVVHRFGRVPPPSLWQEMRSNGFTDLLSTKGVALLTEAFIAEASSSEGDSNSSEFVVLKGVHTFLKGFLRSSDWQAQADNNEYASPKRAQNRPSTVHPLRTIDDLSQESIAIDTIEKLVSWSESQGIDYRGEFEQYDREYTGLVGAMQFKQVLLRLGLKQFSKTMTAEGIIGQLVRQYRSPVKSDAVSYTAMLNRVVVPANHHNLLARCYPASEELRRRTRLRAKFAGKIDQGDASIYENLSPCFSHFDREKKGFLTQENLRTGLSALHFDLSTGQLNELVSVMCIFRNSDTRTIQTLSRMEFDSFIVDPYGFRLLHRLAKRLFERVKSTNQSQETRIALLARSLTQNDAPGFGGSVMRDVFYSLLGNALGRPVLESERHSLQHLFDVNRNARIAYKLFLKVISQWREDNAPISKEMSTPLEQIKQLHDNKGITPLPLEAILSSLHNQLSSIDFNAQIEILNEYMLERDPDRRGFINAAQFVRVFEQVGLSLSRDGHQSVAVYFGRKDHSTSNRPDDDEIAYSELLESLIDVHKQKCTSQTNRK